MIHPNVIVYSLRPDELKSRKTHLVTKLPLKGPAMDKDRGYIDHIRSQQKPNEISEKTTSAFKEDIAQMVKLMGAYCQKASISKINAVIKEIHGTLSSKKPPEIKGWVKLITGLHPQVDKQTRTLGFWKMPYSEVIGTNTLLYYPGTPSIDITAWAVKPYYKDNIVEWRTKPWTAPHYIRESVRQKLDPSSVVQFIQNANLSTTKYMRRNLIWESLITTKSDSGGAESGQSRPIKPKVPAINHGASLNNDWYHQHYRIMTKCKPTAKDNAIAHLDSSEKVSYLVNHLTPLDNCHIAQRTTTQYKAPLGVEETFPRRPTGLAIDVDNSGQPVYKSASTVNNDVLKPEIIEGE